MLKYTVEALAALNKVELRDACRANGIAYNGMNNDGMREVLAKVEVAEEVAATETAPVEAVTEQPREPRVLPDLTQKASPAPEKAPKERKIQANRPEQNGIKRPSEGTICAQIWAWCDEVYQGGKGDKVTAKELKAANPTLDGTTCTVQFYRWRKFNGIAGRQ